MSYLSFLTGSACLIVAALLALAVGLSIQGHSLGPLENITLLSLFFGLIMGFCGTVIGTFLGALASKTAKYAKITGDGFFGMGAVAAPTFLLLLDMKMKGFSSDWGIVFFTPWLSITCGIAAGNWLNEERENLNKASMIMGALFTVSVFALSVFLPIQ